MTNFIENIIEPSRLLLVWMPPDSFHRARYIVGKIDRLGDAFTLSYFTDSKDFIKAKKCGFGGYPAFRDTNVQHSSGVIDAFMRRLPPRNRGDFNKYLELLRVSGGSEFSDFALLGYSGAKLPGDGFSLIHPFDNVIGPCELLTEVAGFRYIEDVAVEDIIIGDEVSFVPEPDNQYDPDAIKIMLNKKKIGYVNRGQLPAFRRWINDSNISAVIERSNGRPDRPLIYLFVKVLPVPTQMRSAG
ncbi:MAG: HIRAN domain-containing protein [Gammaproteobacteria bacterium]|nr:HIRAN domain-containing protein [Gammaproteobacteria bacterium]